MSKEEKFIVAIGSSSGGLNPMIAFFDCTPNDSVTYIILRHLPFTYKSKLQQILQSHSRLKVIEAEDNMVIEQDTIYAAPASMYMTIRDDCLFLDPRTNFPMYPNWSTNIFLSSLSKDKGKRAISVILSGGGSDGSKGACDIKAAGGLVIAQNPYSCEQQGMPVNAIRTGCVDYILSPEDMPGLILAHVNQSLPNL